MDKTIHVRFGKYVFAFLFENNEITDFFKLHFNKYISDSAQDVSIIITVLPTAKTPFIKPGARYTHSVNKEKFNFGPGLIRGQWDAQKKICHLLISKSLLKTEEIWLFNRFLCRLFYTLSLEEKTEKKNDIIIHSSGVLKNGKGYMFFGPPESGKSTIAGLSDKYEVLNDDMNLVHIKGNEISFEGIPFNPRQLELSGKSGPLSMIFSLHKNEKVKIEKGTSEEFAKSVIPEVFLPLTLLSEDRKKAFKYLLKSVKKLGEMIPYYRLYFKKDDSFWKKIETVEEDYGRHQKVLYQKD